VFSATLPKLVEAFRSGGGVPYEDYGTGCVSAQGLENQALFLNEYVANWVPAMPGVEQTLQDGGRVADVGCGVGWSAIALAKGFPAIQIDAIDPDERSIIAAKRNAEAAGLDGRIRFHQSTLEDAQIKGPYDLVTIFESLHDMPYPVQVLRRIRELLAPNGSALITDMAVGETLEENTNFFGHICYNFSVLHCLPQAMGFPGTAATGTMMGTVKMRASAEQAGFKNVEILPVENPKWRFYLLKP
jgi:ubiquinone/menaquinone biosynthesis C-methylase UbiE